jgi:hypothetical protein
MKLMHSPKFFMNLMLQNLYETHAPISFYETHAPKFVWSSYSKVFMKLILQNVCETHAPKFFLPQCLDDWLCIKFLMTQHNFLSLETLDWTLIGNMFEFHNIVSLFYVMYLMLHCMCLRVVNKILLENWLQCIK